MKLINKKVLVFGLTGSKNLSKEVCAHLGVKCQDVERIRFSDGEILVRPLVSVRNHDVVVIQSTCEPVNDNLMELLIFIDALKRGSARNIHCVCPYFGYARQDRKVLPRQPISAKLVANLITAAGAHRFSSFDLHSSQIQAFFDIPADDLQGWVEIIKRVKLNSNSVIISPDKGGINKARSIAETLGLKLGMLDKRRNRPNEVEQVNVLGGQYIENSHCIIIDDMIDTGNTIVKGIIALKQYGAKKITIICTHAILSGSAIVNLDKSAADEIFFANTIDWSGIKMPPKFKSVSIGMYLSEIINALTSAASVSDIVHHHQQMIIQSPKTDYNT